MLGDVFQTSLQKLKTQSNRDFGILPTTPRGNLTDRGMRSNIMSRELLGQTTTFSSTFKQGPVSRDQPKRECEKHGNRTVKQNKFFQTHLGLSEHNIRAFTESKEELYRGVAPNRRQDKKLDYRESIQQIEDIINGTDELPKNQRKAAVEAAMRSKQVSSMMNSMNTTKNDELQNPHFEKIQRLKEIQAEKFKIYKMKKSQLISNLQSVPEADQKSVRAQQEDGKKKAVKFQSYDNFKPLEAIDEADNEEVAAQKFENYFSPTRLV